MKNTLLFLSITIILSACAAKKKISINNIVMDEKAEQEVLLGACNKDGLKDERFITWYNESYSTYEADLGIVEQFNFDEKPDLKVLLVFGTWCSDSKREVPRFFKILEESDFNSSALKMYGVNREKTSPGINKEKLDIQRVPTFIFYKNDVEIGRIIETPQQTLELDMLSILEKYND